MKKWTALILVLAMCLSLCACAARNERKAAAQAEDREAAFAAVEEKLKEVESNYGGYIVDTNYDETDGTYYVVAGVDYDAVLAYCQNQYSSSSSEKIKAAADAMAALMDRDEDKVSALMSDIKAAVQQVLDEQGVTLEHLEFGYLTQKGEAISY